MAFYESTKHPQIKKYPDKRTGAVRYLVRYRNDLNRLTMKRGFTTLRDAKDFLVETESAKSDGSFVPQSAGRATVGALGETWLAHKRAVVSRTYGRTLQSSWDTHVEKRWGSVAIAQIRTTAVRDWVGELSLAKSASVVHRAYGILASILDDAVDDRLLARNPARGVQLPSKKSAPRRYLTAAEVEAVADTVGERWRVLVLILAWTGLRWGEATALRVRDVNQVRRRLFVERAAEQVEGEWHVTDTKGHQRRSVPMPRSVFEELKAYIKELPDPHDRGPERLLFPPARNADGFLYPPRKAAPRTDRKNGANRVDWLEAGLREAGIPYLSPHELRHTAASLAVSAGANVKALQRMLGHKHASLTLDTYADLFDADLDDVADALEASRQKARREHNLSTTAPEITPDHQGPPEEEPQVRQQIA